MLPQVFFALNSTIHQGTKFSPFQVIFSYDVQLPLDLALHSLHNSKVQHAIDFVKNKEAVCQKVTQSLQDYNQKMKTAADSSWKQEDFAIGDQVWLSTRNSQVPEKLSKKLSPRQIGPCKILWKIGAVSYKLELPPGLRKIHPVFHASLLKQYEGSHHVARAPIFTSDDSQEFEVENIIAMRTHKNRREYLVQWKGYSVYDRTWEPEHNLTNAHKLLQQFHQSRGHDFF